MSTPLFVQTPFAGNGITNNIVGEDLSSLVDVIYDLTDIATEPTLVEELTWSARDFSTLEGQLIVGISDGVNGYRLIGAYDLSAGTATLFASGRIALNVTIPTGFRLGVAHNVKKTGGVLYATVDIVPFGGIVR